MDKVGITAYPTLNRHRWRRITRCVSILDEIFGYAVSQCDIRVSAAVEPPAWSYIRRLLFHLFYFPAVGEELTGIPCVYHNGDFILLS